MTDFENVLLLNNNYLVIDANYNFNHNHNVSNNIFDNLINNFCGQIIYSNEFDKLFELNNSSNKLIYLCGNIINLFNELFRNSLNYHNLISHKYQIIDIFSYYDNLNLSSDIDFKIIKIGQIPFNVKNIGVYFKNYFDSNVDYFKNISNEHVFQTLTESNKKSNAFRNGIYLTPIVSESKSESNLNSESKSEEKLHFKLLRCSSNFDGPTDNFRNTDNSILESLNSISKYFFNCEFELNHVLAQIYNNFSHENNKSSKAKIKAHSDKTKDMQKNGIMAFCTFYDFSNINISDLSNIKLDNFDYYYNIIHPSNSILTKLRFKLKSDIVDQSKFIDTFDIVLYPNSVFIMSLKTNRLYTHEIIPSFLPIYLLPIRMGYVVRCSNRNAYFYNGQTYIKYDDDANYTPLHEMTLNEMINVKKSYYEENTTSLTINYPNIYSSMNKGDYMKPNV